MRTTQGLALIGACALGCGSKARPAASASPPPVVDAAPTATPVAPAPSEALAPMPAGFAEADLAVLDHGEIVFYRAADTLRETARVTLPGADPEMFGFQGDWIDRDSLAVSRGDRDALRLSKDGAVPLAVPDAAVFKTARPASDDPELGEGGMEGRFTVVGGAVWWSQCAWSMPYDGGVCEIWVNARLWPTPAREEAASPVATRAFAWPTAAAKGYTVAAAGEDAVRCTAPGARRPQTFTSDADASEHIDTFHWVSVDPPRLLISYGQDGYASLIPNRWTLHDGCKPAPLAAGAAIDVGPGDLWIGTAGPADGAAEDAPSTLTVFRGARVVGAVAIGQSASVRFRPAAN